MMAAGRILVAFLGLVAAAEACADIDAYGEDECGNNVVEPGAGEDCDLIVDSALGEDLECGPPESGPGECRYVCDGAECPRGWTCADDGICRAASGTFEVDGDPVAIVAAQQIALHDVLGEAEAELVARVEGDVLVFRDDGEGFRAALDLSIPNARGDLSFADVDGDELTDLLAPGASVALDPSAQLRVHALRTGGERLSTAIVPQLQMSSPLAAVAAVPADPGAAEVLLQVQRTGEGLVAHVQPTGCVEAPASSTATLGGVASAEVSLPSAARMFGAAIGHAAIATPGDAAVALLRVERTCGTDVCTPAHTVGQPCVAAVSVAQSIAMPAAVAAPGCLLLDVDGAAGPDLLCHLDGDRIGVALDEGDGLGPAVDFAATFSGLDDLPAAQGRACAPVHRILAGADLDGDGRTDVVTPHGVFVADAAGGFVRVHARTLGDAWGEAVIGDFDGDGGLEIVASVLQAEGGCAPARLQALVETGGAYSAAAVRDSALVSNLQRGDFDGDGTDDVAAVSSRPEETRVVVFFGDGEDPLEDQVWVGGFGSVSALAALRSREGTEINDDLVGDLAIASDDGEALTWVTGTTKRSLLSPLRLPVAASTEGTVPATVIAGALAPRAGAAAPDDARPPDVLAIRGADAWLVRDDDLHHGDDPLVLPPDAFGLRTHCAKFAVGTPSPTGGSLIAAVDGHPLRLSEAPHDCDLDAVPTLVVARFQGTRDAPSLVRSLVPLVGTARRPAIAGVLDFDGSGADDVLVHLSHDGETRRGTLVWLRDPIPGTSALAVQPLAETHDVLAAVPIDADADAGLELALLTTDGLRIADWEPGRDPALSISEPVFDLPRPPGPADFVALAAGDIDGNDIFDLALLVADAIYLYPAIETE